VHNARGCRTFERTEEGTLATCRRCSRRAGLLVCRLDCGRTWRAGWFAPLACVCVAAEDPPPLGAWTASIPAASTGRGGATVGSVRSRRHLPCVIQRYCVFTFDRASDRALHIASQLHLHPLRLGPPHAKRLPGRPPLIEATPPSIAEKDFGRHPETQRNITAAAARSNTFGRGRST